MSVFENDREMFEVIKKELYTAVCCDVMDSMGYRNQAMRHNIRPVVEDMVLVGRAKTLLAADIQEIYDNPYEKEIAALDSVVEGEIIVIDTNESTYSGIWGELLTTAALMRGGKGAVVDGLSRDIWKIKNMDFPLFAVGYRPLDSQGRGYIFDYDCAINCGGVRVEPNDIIFGDIDGVIVIPKKIALDVVEAAQDKVSKENHTRNELLQGKLLKDVYEKYGVL
jgi:4-hydroxy-4-methyl-2-oxoglutarate aldolase